VKIIKMASGKQTIKISKKEWQNIGKKAGWIEAQTISSDGYVDGGEPYTDEELDLYNSKERIQGIPELLEAQFGGVVRRNGDDFHWETQDETMGTAYIDVSYNYYDDTMHISKVYESEAMDDAMGESFKIESVKVNVESTIDKVLKRVKSWLGK